MENLLVTNAHIRGTNHNSFRHYEWALIIGVKVCRSDDLEPRLCFECKFDDGVIDYIAVNDNHNYELNL